MGNGIPKLLAMSASSWVGEVISNPLVKAHSVQTYARAMLHITRIDRGDLLLLTEPAGESQSETGSLWNTLKGAVNIADTELMLPQDLQLLRRLRKGNTPTSSAEEATLLPVLSGKTVVESQHVPKTEEVATTYPDDFTREMFNAVREGDCESLRSLLSEHTDKLWSLDSDSHTVVHLAASTNQAEALRCLLSVARESGRSYAAEINAEGSDGSTALLRACNGGRLEAATILLQDQHVDVTLADCEGDNALHMACYGQSLAVVKLLIAHTGIDVNACNKRGWSALMVAIGNDDEKVVEFLLALPAVDVNIMDTLGKSALLLACEWNRIAIIRQLLVLPNIDVNHVDHEGLCPLAASVRGGHTEVALQILQREDVSVDVTHPKLGTVVFLACHSNVEILQVILGKTQQDLNGRFNFTDRQGLSDDLVALHGACANGNVEVIKLLLSAGADVNCRGSRGNINTVALELAKYSQFVAVTQVLDTVDLDLNARSNSGQTLLHWCWSSPETVEQLCSYPSVDVNALDNKRMTPLIFAINCGGSAAAQCLVRQPNIDPRCVDADGFSAVMLCAVRNDNEVLRSLLLLFKDLDVNTLDTSKCTPLMHAAFRNHTEVVRSLFELSGDRLLPHLADKSNRTALSLAITQGHAETVQILLDNLSHDATSFAPAVRGALLLAAGADQSKLVDILLSAPCASCVDINDTDARGRTPLILAIELAHTDFALALLRHSGHVFAQRWSYSSAKYENALEAAIRNKQPAVITAILEHQDHLLRKAEKEAAFRVASAAESFDCAVLLVLIKNEAVLLSDVCTFADTMDRKQSALSIWLLYACSATHVRAGRFSDAIALLSLCVVKGSCDYAVCKELLALELQHEACAATCLVKYQDSAYLTCMIHYQQGNFAEALAGMRTLQVAGGGWNCDALLCLILTQLHRFDEALDVVERFENATDSSVTDYNLHAQYVKGLIFLALGQTRRSCSTFADVVRVSRAFMEASVYALKILADAGLLEDADRHCKQLMGNFHVLSYLEKKLLRRIADRIDITQHVRTTAAQLRKFEEMRADLDNCMGQLFADEVQPSNDSIVLLWNVTAAKVRLLSLCSNFSLTRDEVPDLVSEMKEFLQMLKTEHLIPQSQLGNLVNFGHYVAPSKRTFSAGVVNGAESKFYRGHAIFKNVMALTEKLRRVASSINTLSEVLQDSKPNQLRAMSESTKEQLARLQAHLTEQCALDSAADTAALENAYEVERARLRSEFATFAGNLEDSENNLHRLLGTIERCIIHYEMYCDQFILEYGEQSWFCRNAVGKGGRQRYLTELAALIEARTARLSAERELSAPHELVRIHVHTDSGSRGGDKHLRGFHIPNESERELYRKFSLHRPKSDTAFGSHGVVQHDGVFYKYRPYAPGVEHAVNSLNRLLLDEISLPTKLMKLEGRSEGNFGDVAYYQASVAIEGSSLHDVLSDSQLLKLVDVRSFSAVFISSIFVGTGDAKPDNFIARVTTDSYNADGTAVRLISIDNDIAFCNARLRFRVLPSGKGKLSTDLLNILFFFPQMDQPIDPAMRQTVIGRASTPETIMAAWLRDLYEQNGRYAELLKSGFIERDLQLLKLPIKLPKNCSVLLYRRFILLHEMLTDNPNVTHATILRAFYPGICEFYQIRRARMAKGGEVDAIRDLYIDSCEDQDVIALMKSKDNIKSKAGWSSASKSREMDRETFSSVFSDTVEENAAQFLSMIDFSQPRLRNERAAFSILGKALNFLEKFRLLNASVDQLEWIFDSWFNPIPGSSPPRLKEVQLCSAEGSDDALDNSTIVARLRNELNLTVSFDCMDDPETSPKRFYGKMMPPKKTPLPTEYETLTSSIHELLAKLHDNPTTPVKLAKCVGDVITLVHNASPMDIDKLVAEGSVVEEGVDSLFSQFSLLLLDQVELIPVAVELAQKGAFNGQSALVHNLIKHPKVAAYVELITCIVRDCPELVLLRDAATGSLPADQILLLPPSYKPVKYQLLSALINQTTRLPKIYMEPEVYGEDSDVEAFPNLVSSFPEDLKLIIYAASFGFEATADEVESGVIALDKLLQQSGTLLHACLHNFCPWRSERTTQLFLDAVEGGLRRERLNQVDVDTALWIMVAHGKTVWQLVLERKLFTVADALHESWRGYDHVGMLFDTGTGEHKLCGADPIVRVITQCFYLVGWPLSCTELHAILYEPPAGETPAQRTSRMQADAVSARFSRISPALTVFLNTRTNAAGNSLLYELTVTPDSAYKSRISADIAANIVEHVLKCGADPRFTKRRNKEDPIAVADRNNRGSGAFSKLLRKYL